MEATHPIVGSVVINAIDHDRIVDFWCRLLGVGIAKSHAPYFTWLAPQHPGGISVAIQTVENPTPGRNRVHLDTSVPDIEEAARFIESLGGSMVEEHAIEGFAWKVMADPEGNEFCIAPG